MKKLLILLFLLALLPTAGMAQDGIPSIAILRFGTLLANDFTEGAILDMLESYGYITADENRTLEERRDLEGDSIDIYWGDAGFEYPNINFMLEAALDKDVDVLVTLGAPVTQIAVNQTLAMDEPPALFFTSVYNPFESGIAAASCIKPAHVTGSEVVTDYEYVFRSLLMQDADVQSIGTIFGSGEASGIVGAGRIAELAFAVGMSVDAVGVTSYPDLRAAAEGLLDDGAQAIVLPIDSITTSGLPVIVTVANEYGVPVFHPSMGGVQLGATIGAGYDRYYENGIHVGRMLTAYLRGELDLASTGINSATGKGIGINYDSAFEQGIDIAEALQEEAEFIMEYGRSSWISEERAEEFAKQGIVVPLEDRYEDDMAWLAALHCSAEMIAEQQAELDSDA